MVYTITLNPALDRTLWVEKIETDDSNRIEREERYAGGKGIDVSRVLTTFGVDNKALGFVGGFTGAELEGRMLNEGIQCDFTRISGETRTNVIINDMSTDSQTLFSGKGPEIEPFELIQIIRKIEALENPEIVIISGSLPLGVHPEIYRKIIEIAKGKGTASVIVDTDGNALKFSIQGLPSVIKPNVRELSRLVNAELKEMSYILEAARHIREQGVAIVLVSMGAQGILLVEEKNCYLAAPPPVKAVNTVGAGDSAVAGFVYGLIQEETLKQALVYAVAAGTATTLRPGSALCEKDDFLALVPRIEVQEM
ncbi:MAG: 1-phosphofructokinase [Deltaproteobacteria bacterium]|nr:1-phosphofructokinase [Deltaproteobacteria bacterium]